MQQFNWTSKLNSISLTWSSSLQPSDPLLCLSNVRMISGKRGTFTDTLHQTALNLSQTFWPSQRISLTLFATIATPVSSHLRTVRWSSESSRQTWTLKILTPITFKTCWKWQTFESTSHDSTRSATTCSTTDLRSTRNIITQSPTWLFVVHVLAMVMLLVVYLWKGSTHRTTWFMADANVRITLRVWTVSIVRISITICHGSLRWASKQTPAKVSCS